LGLARVARKTMLLRIIHLRTSVPAVLAPTRFAWGVVVGSLPAAGAAPRSAIVGTPEPVRFRPVTAPTARHPGSRLVHPTVLIPPEAHPMRRRQQILDQYPPDTTARVVAVSFRCAPHEFAALTAAADACGKPVGAYVRDLALTGKAPAPAPPRPAETDREALAELRQVGTNLNQAAHALNGARKAGEVIGTQPLVELAATVRACRAAVLRLTAGMPGEDEVLAQGQRDAEVADRDLVRRTVMPAVGRPAEAPVPAAPAASPGEGGKPAKRPWSV
jgi:hypothetical protein